MSETELPMLSEHQAPTLNTTSPTEYVPTDEERKTLKLVNSLFEKAKKWRRKYDENWLDDYKMFRGKQWKEQRPTYRHSEVINFIFQAIQSVVPVMTDNRPKFDFLPQEPGDYELSQILSQVAQHDWEKNNWMIPLCEMIYDGHFYGTGIGSMEYNPDANRGAGAIQFESDDPMYTFPDPNARDVNKRSKFYIYAEPTDVELLKAQYPAKKDYIKPDLIDLIKGDRSDINLVEYKSPTNINTIIEGTSAYDSTARNQALKITAYIYSDEFDEEEVVKKNPDGTQATEYQQKLRYPNGRKVCIAGGVVLDDGPMPYEDGLIPKARYCNYILPREFWGMSEIEQLRGPQKIFNKIVSFALDVLTLMGNPIWVVGNGSGVDTDNLFNRPGLIVEADDPNLVRREEGVQLQPYVLQLIDRLENWFQDISGRTDVTQGAQPGGITAASAIANLQDAAQTRIRLKARNLDATLQDLGRLWLARTFQFRTAPEIVRLTGNDGAIQYFKFHVDHQPVMDETGQPTGDVRKVVNVRNYNPDPVTGEMKEDLEAKQLIVNGDFDIRVTTGSSLPFAKSQKIQLAEALFDRQAIDQLELLKAAEWPNYEAVYQRMQDQKMQAAAAAAGAPPPGAGPTGAPPMAGAGGPPPPPAGVA